MSFFVLPLSRDLPHLRRAGHPAAHRAVPHRAGHRLERPVLVRMDPAGTALAGRAVVLLRRRTRTDTPARRSSLGFGPVGRWWDDKSVVRTIGLRKEQQQKMDAIFNADKPAILTSYKTYLSEQSKLDALNKDPKADKANVFAAIDAVSQARASLQKATSQMLLEIRQEMDPGQITKLEQLQ